MIDTLSWKQTARRGVVGWTIVLVAVLGSACGTPEAETPSVEPASAPLQAVAASSLDADAARARLLELPEVIAWRDRVAATSEGQASAGVRLRPDAEVIDGRTYWCFELTEERPERSQRWRNFLVAVDDGQILTEDDADGWQTLATWREAHTD